MTYGERNKDINDRRRKSQGGKNFDIEGEI
jgi:hypothetical protein